jgi:succinate dehydrogenase / fumarate reductase cytochrome b subunit
MVYSTVNDARILMLLIALTILAGYNQEYFVRADFNKHKLSEGILAAVNNHRPKNLNLLTIRQPLPAIVSILHRISGIILFLLIPLFLWGLKQSLASQQDFDSLKDFLSTPLMKFLVWGFLSAFIYHFVAGVRHLLMNLHIGEELKSGRITAKFTMIISILFIIMTGIWLW